MEKPRIILADTDLNYLLPLQQCFVERFGDTISLEIIDSVEYLKSLFSVPQKITLLAIEENLYNPSFSIHSIDRLFFLCESDSVKALQGEARSVYKYSSIIEVFNRLYSAISPTNQREKTQIVAVSSAAGGVGKTTLSLGVAAFLARCGKSVLYINASQLQTFQCHFSDQSAITSSDVYQKILNPGRNVYKDIKAAIRQESFSYLPAFKLPLIALGIPNSVYGSIAVSAKESGDFDYIIVDMESSFDNAAAKLMGVADAVFLVTGQGRDSIFATERLASNINGISGEKYSFVCCNFNDEEENALLILDEKAHFSVSEYVPHFDSYSHLGFKEIASEESIQRVAMLVM